RTPAYRLLQARSARALVGLCSFQYPLVHEASCWIRQRTTILDQYSSMLMRHTTRVKWRFASPVIIVSLIPPDRECFFSHDLSRCRGLETSNSIPPGLRPTAQGCRTRLPWDRRSAMAPNPNGVAALACRATRSGRGAGRNLFEVENDLGLSAPRNPG